MLRYLTSKKLLHILLFGEAGKNKSSLAAFFSNAESNPRSCLWEEGTDEWKAVTVVESLQQKFPKFHDYWLQFE